jgi:hypothetical protein
LSKKAPPPRCPLFDENNGRLFQSISKTLIRKRETKSGDKGR